MACSRHGVSADVSATHLPKKPLENPRVVVVCWCSFKPSASYCTIFESSTFGRNFLGEIGTFDRFRMLDPTPPVNHANSGKFLYLNISTDFVESLYCTISSSPLQTLGNGDRKFYILPIARREPSTISAHT